MFTFMHNLWMTLQCPPPMKLLAEAYQEPTATEAITHLDTWLPYLCDYDKGELLLQMSYDLCEHFKPGEYNDQLFDWLTINHPL